MTHPSRINRNIRSSFNNYLKTSCPTITFNFSEAEFDTANISKWVQVDYLSRTLNVKPLLVVQLTFFAKEDRYGTKVEEICDQVMDKLYGATGSNDLRAIPVKDWFETLGGVPVQIGAVCVSPRQANKPVLDQYGVTSITTTVELRQSRK
jgi:hypothetical protein